MFKDYKDRKKTVKHKRGYFSEIIKSTCDDEKPRETESEEVGREDSAAASEKRAKLTWEGKTERHSPIIDRLDAPTPTKLITDETQWVSFDQDSKFLFPAQSLKPKVHVAYEVPSGELPRKVLVERMRREYQEYNVQKLLKNLGVEEKDLVLPRHFLPLHIFDNEEYDCRLQEEWMELGIVDGVAHPVPAEALIPLDQVHCAGEEECLHHAECLDWQTVAVVDYEEKTRLYQVVPIRGADTTYKLPRILVRFIAEDPRIFAERVRDAVERRKDAEIKIRFETYIDCMALCDAGGLDADALSRILSWATCYGKLRYPDHLLGQLEGEMMLNFKRTMNEARFRNTVSKNSKRFHYISLPRREEPSVPERGAVEVFMEDFTETKTRLHKLTLYVLPEVYEAMRHVTEECAKLSSLSFFTLVFGKNVHLQEFQSIQNQATLNTMKYLKGPWFDGVTQGVIMKLRDVGKGWFNIYDSDRDIYEFSKISRMMELIKFRMQESVKDMVISSGVMFTNLIEAPSLCVIADEDSIWGNDLVNSPYKCEAAPIFNVVLKMDENSVFYSTNPDDFEGVLVDLFDNAITLSHSIRQAHAFVMINLTLDEDVCLSSVGLLDEFMSGLRERIRIAMRKSASVLKSYANEYYKYMDLWKMDVKSYVTQFDEAQHSALEYKEEASEHYKMKINLEVTLPDKIVIGPFIVNVDPLKQFLVDKMRQLYVMLLDSFVAQQRERVEQVLAEYKATMRRLTEKPISIENVEETREWMETIPINMAGQHEVMKRLFLEYDILDAFRYNLKDDDFEAKWEGLSWPHRIYQQMEATAIFLEEETEKFEKLQFADEVALMEKIEQLNVQVMNLTLQSDMDKVHEYAVECRKVWKALLECQQQGLLLNTRQRLFGKPVVPYDNLSKLMKEFEIYKNLWISASDWQRLYLIWMGNPLVNIDADTIESTVNESHKTMIRAVRTFAELPKLQQVAMNIKDDIEEFKPFIPLLLALRDPGMKERHWNMIFEETGIKLEMSPTTTFQSCLDAGLGEYKEEVIHVAELAKKEFSIESALTKMQNEWEEISLEITPYKETRTYIMKISDDAAQMLDDHIVLTQHHSFSPFKAAFEKQIAEWEDKLHLAQDVIELWIECQQQWMYLEPIFSSQDINRQLPVEAKKFGTVDRNWRRVMKNAFNMPKVMEVCPDKPLLETFKECNSLLEQVQKGLADYLETKRMVFPRFYFLSDDELLEILSQAMNPIAVQPHLKKCFENISLLHFMEDLEITAMYSAEGERVQLTPSMYPVGNVEDWLLNVESIMRNTLRVTLGEALLDLAGKEDDRSEWVLNWPGQLVIAGSQVMWTAQVENAILQNELPRYYETMLQQLDGLRGLVKGPLKRVERQVLSALIVIEVHARDVLNDLVEENVGNVNDFEWIRQLRYYWVSDELRVRAVNADFPYGYEYLGNSGRLVITPLTDRCYLTLVGALHLKFGGAPAGPAGTGKTETTKDLAKAFAIQCVVFNCSDQLDFMAMGKFFKGLASSGAWACFDEFNRIDIEVLSVVAQQITTIQKAQQARMERFLFEGADIALKESCAVFITMNPGYAGRTELPDNLKALFRPVAMMVPNYALIAEISLFSFGFSDAKELAGKITTTFKLSSEQLSSQDHYDFGMRAVKTVIAVAGNLKREMPDLEERQIVLRALRDVNVPKFLRDDLKLFNGIVSDLFPRMVEQQVDYGDLEIAIRASCLKFKLEDVAEFVHKVIQLYDTTVVRHGLMLVGPPVAGKTKIVPPFSVQSVSV